MHIPAEAHASLYTEYKLVCQFLLPHYQDCPSHLTSDKTVNNLLLPAETAVRDKRLPAETVRVILLPEETLGRKQNHADSLVRKIFWGW